jgi:hypothetical protein
MPTAPVYMRCQGAYQLTSTVPRVDRSGRRSQPVWCAIIQLLAPDWQLTVISDRRTFVWHLGHIAFLVLRRLKELKQPDGLAKNRVALWVLAAGLRIMSAGEPGRSKIKSTFDQFYCRQANLPLSLIAIGYAP